MRQAARSTAFSQHDTAILRYGTPEQVLVACLFSCAVGIAITAVTARYLLMLVLVAVILSVIVTALLVKAGKISLTAACLVPMLLLCFVFTPLCWYTYNGLLGCTPYLSILLLAMITLTTFKKVQTALLLLYSVMILTLVVHWFRGEAGGANTEQACSILLCYLLAATLIVTMTEAMKRKNAEVNQQATDLSLRDDLTELLNRRAVQQVLCVQESALCEGLSDYAVVMMDIDKFKSINDTFGHDLGDSILQSTAAAIQGNIRTGDHAFRLGGDEFLIVLPQVTHAIAEQICSRIEKGVSALHGYAFPLTISAGCAFRSECADTKELLAMADQRMYQNKRAKV